MSPLGDISPQTGPFLKEVEKEPAKPVDLSIIVPVLNEGDALPVLAEELRREMDQLGRAWEVIFINDRSTDQSEKILNELADQDERFRVIHFRRNVGQTAAMMAGFDFAKGKILIPIDGDGENDPADIAKMLDLLEHGYDVVSGWRKDPQDNFIRLNLPRILANRLISLVSGVRLHDFGCSLKAYRRTVVDGIRLYGEMHRFLPIYASWHGAKITEVAVSHHPRRGGRSKYGLERVAKVLLDLLVVKFLDSAAQKPMYVFGGCGIFSLALSVLAFLWMLYLKIFKNFPFITTPVPLIVVMTFMIGMMCILLGLLAEMIMRTFYESQGKPIYNIRESRNLEGTNGSRRRP
jgi:glycosyltransferase involved in cell wall biosynthesis